MNFVDRGLLANFAVFLVLDLGLSNTEFGLLTGLVFLLRYFTMGLFMGVPTDRVNPTWLIAFLRRALGSPQAFITLACQ